jgi:hypothetical protein
VLVLKYFIHPKIVIPNPALSGEESAFSWRNETDPSHKAVRDDMRECVPSRINCTQIQFFKPQKFIGVKCFYVD